MNMLITRPVSILCFDNEGGDPGDGGAAAAAAAASPSSGAGADPNAGDGGGERTFTQAEVNKIMAENKRKLREQYAQLEEENKELLKNQNLTQEARDKLQARIADLQKAQLTEKQQIEFDRKQAEEKYQAELQTAQQQADHWENLYKKETVDRALLDAASGAEAFNPSHIVALLRPNTELKDIEGVLTPMVDFPDVDEKTGDPVQTLCSPADAVKRMRQLPKVHGCLFKSNVVAGVGSGQGAVHDPGDIDYTTMDAETYRKHRSEIKNRVPS
jgi:ASC-1-like (ASCH) protein